MRSCGHARTRQGTPLHVIAISHSPTCSHPILLLPSSLYRVEQATTRAEEAVPRGGDAMDRKGDRQQRGQRRERRLMTSRARVVLASLVFCARRTCGPCVCWWVVYVLPGAHAHVALRGIVCAAATCVRVECPCGAAACVLWPDNNAAHKLFHGMIKAGRTVLRSLVVHACK